MTNRNRQASPTNADPSRLRTCDAGSDIRFPAKPDPNRFPQPCDKAQAVERFGPPKPHGCATADRRLGPRTWLSTNVACDYFAGRFRRHESVTF